MRQTGKCTITLGGRECTWSTLPNAPEMYSKTKIGKHPLDFVIRILVALTRAQPDRRGCSERMVYRVVTLNTGYSFKKFG